MEDRNEESLFALQKKIESTMSHLELLKSELDIFLRFTKICYSETETKERIEDFYNRMRKICNHFGNEEKISKEDKTDEEDDGSLSQAAACSCSCFAMP